MSADQTTNVKFAKKVMVLMPTKAVYLVRISVAHSAIWDSKAAYTSQHVFPPKITTEWIHRLEWRPWSPTCKKACTTVVHGDKKWCVLLGAAHATQKSVFLVLLLTLWLMVLAKQLAICRRHYLSFITLLILLVMTALVLLMGLKGARLACLTIHFKNQYV